MKIYQAYMDAQQRTFVCDGAIPFDAAANSAPGTREYELFRQLHADPANRDGGTPWGLLSWKFEHKAPIGFHAFHEFCRRAFADGADCAFINPMIGNEAVYANVWEQGIHCAHTGIEQIAYFLEQHLGIRVAAVSDAGTFAFCNYFVARRDFWDAYFDFIERALALLEAEAVRGTEVGRIYSGSGQYERDTSASMRVFVIERLFSSFLLQQERFTVRAWSPTADDYARKFGARLGELLWNLHRVKQRAVAADDLPIYQAWDRQRSALLADWHIHIVWNLDDPFAMPLTREYREFREYCSGLFDAGHDAQRRPVLRNTAS
jgi:hypothetical protein